MAGHPTGMARVTLLSPKVKKDANSNNKIVLTNTQVFDRILGTGQIQDNYSHEKTPLLASPFKDEKPIVEPLSTRTKRKLQFANVPTNSGQIDGLRDMMMEGEDEHVQKSIF